VNDSLIETALQFFQRHPSCLRRCVRIVDAIGRVEESLFKALRHPPKERFDRSFCGWSVWGRLLRDDAKPIYQDRPGALRGEDLSSVMEDDRRLSKTGPGMLTSSDANQVIFPFQAELDQAHIVLFLERSQS